jgi:hypothetical protein
MLKMVKRHERRTYFNKYDDIVWTAHITNESAELKDKKPLR